MYAVTVAVHSADPEDKTLNKNPKLASLSQGLQETKTSKKTKSQRQNIVVNLLEKKIFFFT